MRLGIGWPRINLGHPRFLLVIYIFSLLWAFLPRPFLTSQLEKDGKIQKHNCTCICNRTSMCNYASTRKKNDSAAFFQKKKITTSINQYKSPTINKKPNLIQDSTNIGAEARQKIQKYTSKPVES